MTRDLDTASLKLALKGMGLVIGITPARDDNIAHVQPVFAEHIDVTEDVVFVGDSQVFTHLAALEIQGVDGDDNFGLVSKLCKHDNLVIRGESGKNARGVHVVNKLAAKLQVQGPTELLATLRNVFRLKG